MIHYTTEMVREYPNYSCPPYCDVDHKHIGKKWDEFYIRMVGTTDSIYFTGGNFNKDEGGHRCPKGQGEDSLRVME